MFVMHPAAVRRRALDLVARGLNDCEVARRTGVPRSTVRCWRRPTYRRKTAGEVCPRCWQPARLAWFSDTDYAELLGLYLGDGHIVRSGRTYRLRIFLDTAYPAIIEETRWLLDRCFAANEVSGCRSRKGTTTILSVYSRHLPCLFPQHGPGKKHLRPIVLEEWQRACVETAPMNFIRGCIRSDGCFFINRTGRYSYPSYSFVNFSRDIRELFAEACELAGIRYTRSADGIRVYRRESVAVLYRAVGRKR